MPAFGRDGVLKQAEIDTVAAYVLSLSVADQDAAKVAAGKKLFAENCVACHGEDGKGNAELGAPNLTGQFWLYGGAGKVVIASIANGRQGHMPTWEQRLSTLQRKILALYVLDLGSKAQ